MVIGLDTDLVCYDLLKDRRFLSYAKFENKNIKNIVLPCWIDRPRMYDNL